MAPRLVPRCVLVAALTIEAGGSPQRMVLRQALSDAANAADAASISGDGRFVAFVSSGSFAAADVNNVPDIYVLDRADRTMTLETRAFDGGSANGTPSRPRLSGDGRYLVFSSPATNMAADDDRNEKPDVFLRDRVSGVTRRISRTADRESDGGSDSAVISDDGRTVAFVSSATSLVAGTDANGPAGDVYLVRLDTGAITRAGVSTDGRQFVRSYAPALSGDGRFAVFTAMEQSERPGVPAVYLRDTAAGVTTCLSCGSSPAAGLPSFGAQISRDGRVVAFTVQTASHPRRTDIAVHDRPSSTTTVITREANGRSQHPSLSADGRLIVFETWASDLLCRLRCSVHAIDENVLQDVYMLDRASGAYRRLSGEHRGWWAPSVAPQVDAQGESVVFSSRQPFGPEDGTADFDLFVCTPACV